MKSEDCVLYSGAAAGSEAAFGAAAEKHGVDEVNFTFEGHRDARSRGIRVLTHEELKQGDVSLTYVSQLMHRTYKDTPLFKKILQTIWHQVNAGQEVFVIGKILDDKTVKGGTGWGAEFAKICNKSLYVFDQEQASWFRWSGSDFEFASDPVIREHHFCGTGTRLLNDAGEQAIAALYERSFS